MGRRGKGAHEKKPSHVDGFRLWRKRLEKAYQA
ncbi:hypothetical protein FB597_101685 [Herbaspirillum sp. SJZ099]|nr:hypothetical protein FB597_101685 [Herbaspirillum sp. SJZ099]